jgi:hypothetical protein
MWVIVAISILAILLIFAFTSRNFLFAVIIAMFGIIFYLRITREPSTMTCAVTKDGIEIGGSNLEYDTIESFWIIQREDGVHELYIDRKGWNPHRNIPILGTTPEQVRDALAGKIEERTDGEESVAEVVGRALKL